VVGGVVSCLLNLLALFLIGYLFDYLSSVSLRWPISNWCNIPNEVQRAANILFLRVISDSIDE
jgi:hypothetical protein